MSTLGIFVEIRNEINRAPNRMPTSVPRIDVRVLLVPGIRWYQIPRVTGHPRRPGQVLCRLSLSGVRSRRPGRWRTPGPSPLDPHPFGGSPLLSPPRAVRKLLPPKSRKKKGRLSGQHTTRLGQIHSPSNGPEAQHQPDRVGPSGVGFKGSQRVAGERPRERRRRNS
jgi:hypothetical protein